MWTNGFSCPLYYEFLNKRLEFSDNSFKFLGSNGTDDGPQHGFPRRPGRNIHLSLFDESSSYFITFIKELLRVYSRFLDCILFSKASHIPFILFPFPEIFLPLKRTNADLIFKRKHALRVLFDPRSPHIQTAQTNMVKQTQQYITNLHTNTL